MIKMEIRSLTIPDSKNKARNARIHQTQLESRLQSLEEKISSDVTTEDDSQEYERVKIELRVF